MSKNIIRNIGVMPWEIPKALKHAGVSFTCSPDPAILENCKNGGVVIMTYWNEMSSVSVSPCPFSSPVSCSVPNLRKGAHTVAVIYQSGQYYIYNCSNYDVVAHQIPDITSFVEGRYIYGFYIAP
jgi:hypothetical protein